MFIIFNFIIRKAKGMLPKMRYNTAKLSELVHQQKSYRLHVHSVDKIMTKTNNQFVKRSQRLNQLKDRKEQSHSYNHYKKSKEIGHVNSVLFSKIYSSSKIDKKFQSGTTTPQNNSLEMLEEKIRERNQEEEEKQNDKGSLEQPFVLRNHRQYPIHKSTLLERTRENIRLAKKIVNPVITYKTDDFMKMAESNRNHKERIMKYEPQFAKTKADMYVEKKLSLSFMSRKRSQSSFSGSSLERSNPELSPRMGKSKPMGFQIQQGK